ncbi:TPA: hypothetical protein PD879_002498 [Staphylococcus aureus]|uniref:hypothetical protein n=1 Tax=Staphylococcus aureus TaxID=1280 RepID=UPI0028B84811|nr:hypothetical protein [Staphylococcus aureus]HDE9869375.1 hypothetical protein [Staphylococcus aureus]HDF4675568.1 hypothetical protein [Staphylococcus aureus]HDH1976580.1 hypothetical protein [Staphylococcus aureus]HDY5190162.1 hypothetical protein [Staphylococcus aureus]
MAEPMRKKGNEYNPEDIQKTKKKPNIIKRGYRSMKEDIKHGSRVEEGSIIDVVHKTYRSMFPKKK